MPKKVNDFRGDSEQNGNREEGFHKLEIKKPYETAWTIKDEPKLTKAEQLEANRVKADKDKATKREAMVQAEDKAQRAMGLPNSLKDALEEPVSDILERLSNRDRFDCMIGSVKTYAPYLYDLFVKCDMRSEASAIKSLQEVTKQVEKKLASSTIPE